MVFVYTKVIFVNAVLFKKSHVNSMVFSTLETIIIHKKITEKHFQDVA